MSENQWKKIDNKKEVGSLEELEWSDSDCKVIMLIMNKKIIPKLHEICREKSAQEGYNRLEKRMKWNC